MKNTQKETEANEIWVIRENLAFTENAWMLKSHLNSMIRIRFKNSEILGEPFQSSLQLF